MRIITTDGSFLNDPSAQNPTEKVCYKCHNKKLLTEFNKCSSGVYGYHNHCRSCQKEVRHTWYVKHSESECNKSSLWSKSQEGKLSHKRHWEKWKHILGPKQNERRRQEPAKIKARIQRQKWRAIPQNNIACSLRGRLRAALKGFLKFHSTEKLLGCSYEKLKAYLEAKFQEGMTWENYGQWHIDHIKPCSSFDLIKESEQLACFNYTNLQPLWAKDNIQKGNKLS